MGTMQEVDTGGAFLFYLRVHHSSEKISNSAWYRREQDKTQACHRPCKRKVGLARQGLLSKRSWRWSSQAERRDVRHTHHRPRSLVYSYATVGPAEACSVLLPPSPDETAVHYPT